MSGPNLATTKKAQPPKLRSKTVPPAPAAQVDPKPAVSGNKQAEAMVGLADAQSFAAAQAYTDRANQNVQALIALAADTDAAIASTISEATQTAYPLAFEG